MSVDSALAQRLLELGALLARRLALVELLEHDRRLDVRDVGPGRDRTLGQRDDGLVGRAVVSVEYDRESPTVERVTRLEGEDLILRRLVEGQPGEAVLRTEMALPTDDAYSGCDLLRCQGRQGVVGQGGRSLGHGHD